PVNPAYQQRHRITAGIERDKRGQHARRCESKNRVGIRKFRWQSSGDGRAVEVAVRRLDQRAGIVAIGAVEVEGSKGPHLTLRRQFENSPVGVETGTPASARGAVKASISTLNQGAWLCSVVRETERNQSLKYERVAGGMARAKA